MTEIKETKREKVDDQLERSNKEIKDQIIASLLTIALVPNAPVEAMTVVKDAFNEFRSSRQTVELNIGEVKDQDKVSNVSFEGLDGADMSLTAEREFVENEDGEKILMEKEYFSKYSGITVDTWEWVDENGKTHREQIKHNIKWESDGADNPFELTESEFHPTYKDEVGPPPVENAKLVKHGFEGWINDASLWSRQRPVASFKEVPLEEKLKI